MDTEIYILAAKLRLLVKKFSQEEIKDIIIIGPAYYDHVSDIKYIHAPTLENHILINTSFEIASYFENIIINKKDL